MQFNIVQGLEGGANFIADFGNAELGAINTVVRYASFGNLNSNSYLSSLPISPTLPSFKPTSRLVRMSERSTASFRGTLLLIW
jgi:hypothetical protein